MPQCLGNTRDGHQCGRRAAAGGRYCYQHDRRPIPVEAPRPQHINCTSGVDPITFLPLGDDVIRLETAPLRDGMPGPVHCFNADSFKEYIEYNAGTYPWITNPLTGVNIPKAQLDAIITRLHIELPQEPLFDLEDPTAGMSDDAIRAAYRLLYDRGVSTLEHDPDADFREADFRDGLRSILGISLTTFNQGNIRRAHDLLNWHCEMFVW